MKTAKHILAAMTVASCLALPAQASVVLFSDDFDGEGAPAASALNYTGFANWTVTGAVDLVSNGFGGVTCNGGAGKCVDLDGSPGPGELTSSVINYLGGQQVTIKLAYSGNQRSQTSDDFRIRAQFPGATSFELITFADGSSLGAITTIAFSTEFFNIPSNRPWTLLTTSFVPTVAGSFQLLLRTTSADNIGPVIDDVLVTQEESRQPVSEPATLALLGAGLLGLAAARRRRTV